MTLANMDIYFHMLNHYKKIRQAKAVVDTSSPKGVHKKNCSCKQNRTTQCNFQHQPHCPAARNLSRTFTPDHLPVKANICSGQLHEWNRSSSAPPPCKRNNESKEGVHVCRNKPRVDSCLNMGKIHTRKCPALNNKATKQKDNEESETQEIKEEKKESEEIKPEEKNVDDSKEEIAPELKTSEPKEHEYVHFLLVITEDILRNNIYEDEELNKLFESHIQANIDRLDKEEMLQRIEQLKNELNLPLPPRLLCDCLDDNTPAPEADAGKTPESEKALGEIQEVNSELERDVTCEEALCCPKSEPPTPAEETKTQPLTEAPDEPSASSVNVEEPQETKPEEVSIQEVAKLPENVTCEEVSCCPAPQEPEDEKSVTQPKTSISQAIDAKANAPSVSLKNQDGCLDPETCFPDSDQKSDKKSGQVSSMHSMFKIVHKDDPKKTESYIIYYNPNETGEYCSCTTALQKTALKIQTDDVETTEYILVDGPVCMPRAWLETKAIQVLVQNASSMTVHDEEAKENKANCTLSKVNLFQAKNAKPEFDNYDSVSFQITQEQSVEPSDYDLTPQRDTAEGSIKATNNKNLGPILKKAESRESKSSTLKGNNKNMVKLASSDKKKDGSSPTPRSSASEKVTKVHSRKTSAASSVNSSQEETCDNKTCPGYASEDDGTCNKKVCPTYELVDDKTPKKEKVDDDKTICSTGSCEREICPKKVETPKIEDGATKKSRCSFKDKELEAVDNQDLQKATSKGVCSSGSCHRDICPKLTPKIPYKHLSSRSASEQVSDHRVLLSTLSGHNSPQNEETTEDYAAKYHFLLMDATTSTTSLENQHHRKPASALKVVEKVDVPKVEEKKVVNVDIPIAVPVIQTMQDNEYKLLLDEEYQVQNEQQSVSIRSSKSSRSQRLSQFSEGTSEHPKSLSVASPQELRTSASNVSPMGESIEMHDEPRSSVGSTAKSDRSDADRRPGPDLKIFQYSSMPPRMVDPSQEKSNELTYTAKKASNATTENDMFESYRRTSEILQVPVFPTHPALKQQSLVATPSTSSQVNKPELKVRYSLTREMLHDPQHEDLIAKLDEMPSVDSSIRDKETENIDAITERMKQFRKISGDENAFRRFQISNPDNFEIKRVSVESTVIDDDSTTKAKRNCCGLAAAPKTKKRIPGRSSAGNEPSA